MGFILVHLGRALRKHFKCGSFRKKVDLIDLFREIKQLYCHYVNVQRNYEISC